MSITTQLDTLRQLRRFETLVKDDDYNRIARERTVMMADLVREMEALCAIWDRIASIRPDLYVPLPEPEPADEFPEIEGVILI